MASSPTLALRQLWPLHGRAADAGVALAGRDAGGRFTPKDFLRLGSEDQLPMFPRDLAALQARLCARDLYATVNGTSGPSCGSNASVRRLNAVWIDLDGHRLGLTEGQLWDAIHVELREGRLPLWSLLVSSGRGLWVLWFLRDQAGSDLTPPPATPENVKAGVAINRALAGRFKHLGADAGSTNVGRLMRVPGSVNTKAEKLVVWYYVANGDLDHAPVYTLEGFAREAGIDLEAAPHRHPTPARQRAEKAWTKPKKPRGGIRTRFDSGSAKAAAAQRYRGPLDEVLALIRHRGGLHEGHREEGLWTLGHLAGSANWTTAQLAAQVAATLTFPPLRPKRAQAQALNGWEKGRQAWAPLRFETVAQKLGLTREEADALGLRLLGRAIPKPDRKLPAFVAAYKAGTVNGKPPTLRVLQGLMAGEGFHAKSGKPLSLATLRKLRDRAARERLIESVVRRRSSKDRQLRLIASNEGPALVEAAAEPLTA